MSTVALRRFSSPDTLRHIGDRYLIELLSPYREFFTSRGLDLPATPTAGPVDCERLANIFMMPDTDMPPELADSLYYIHEMSLKDTMDKLVEVAEQKHIDLDLPAEAGPADVAVRFWLKDNRLLQEIHAEQHLTRPKSFLYFSTFVNPVPVFNVPNRDTLAAMEATMDTWFESKKRGRGCKVFVYPRENECWFMVRHGETCRREGSLDQGQPGSVFYRPQKHDILVYDIAEGEIRIHAGSKKERELYLRCFGLHIFGSERFFPPGGIFTLKPLIQDREASLSTEGVEEAIEWILLKELEFVIGIPGNNNKEIEIHKAKDLFAVFQNRNFQLPVNTRTKKAVFSFKFRDSKTPRSVTIEPSNKAKYERDYDSDVVKKWMTLRGFINEDAIGE
jgi:hypothetical protein